MAIARLPDNDMKILTDASGIMMPDPWQSQEQDRDTTFYWRYMLETAALKCFVWENLPDDIQSDSIERTLFYYGFGGFFEMEKGKLAFCPGTAQEINNLYQMPRKVQFRAPNGIGTSTSGPVWTRRAQDEVVQGKNGLEIGYADCVVEYDNCMRIPVLSFTTLYANRLARIDRVLDINIGAQTVPWIAEGPDEARTDIKNVLQQVTGMEPCITGNTDFINKMGLQVLKTEAPVIMSELQDARQRELNQIYTLLGIDNQFSDKRVREVTGEIESNNEQIAIMRNSRYDNRKRLCEACNTMFGTQISVRWNVAHDAAGYVDLGDDTETGSRIESEADDL